MNADSGVRSRRSRSTAAWSTTTLLMQFQADVLGVPVIRPKVAETTALGAAYAAGLAIGFWGDLEDLRENWARTTTGSPRWTPRGARRSTRFWKKAVTRTFDWVD